MMAQNRDRASTARHIQVCLFLIELSLAVVMAVSAYLLLRILPFSTSWTAKIFSTVAGLWIIKSTAWALQSLKTRSIPESSIGNDGIVCDDEKNGLAIFEAIEESRMQSSFEPKPKKNRVRFEGCEKDDNQGAKNNPNTPSKEITDTKTFLKDTKDENEHTSKISFPLLALLATVLLQFALRILVIVQNVKRSLPWRGRSARGGLIPFSDIPFTIGRSMSSSGCSFHIFSFLNGWLECKGGGYPHCNSPDAHTHSNMTLQAVSFDRISISSSYFIYNHPRSHPAATSKFSWLGIIFEDIETSMTIRLKRKGRSSLHDDNKSIQSITIRLKMRALEIGVFPSPLDRCKGVGIEVDANATFDAKSILHSGKHPSLSGFGMSMKLDQVNMHRFACTTPSEEENINTQNRVVSWDKIESSLHLHRQNDPPKGVTEGHTRRDTASLLTFPSGFVLIQDSGGASASTSPFSNRARVNLGDFLCKNRFALGVHLKHMRTFVESAELLLQNISSSMIRGSAMKNDTCTNSKAKNKTPVELVELNATISTHLYTPEITNAAASLGCFSFRAPHSILHWKNADGVQTTQNTQENVDSRHILLTIDSRDAKLRYEVLSGVRLDDNNSKALDLFVFKRIKTKLTSDDVHMGDGSKCVEINLGGIVARTGGDAVNELANIMKASEDIKAAMVNLQRSAKEMRTTLSKQNLSKTSTSESQKGKQGSLRRINVSCDSVDAAIELLEGGITNSDRVRLALLLGGSSVTILRKEGHLHEKPYLSVNSVTSGVHLPGQCFDSDVQTCAQHFLIEATVTRAESSVTFYPHASLPVIDESLPKDPPPTSQHNQETSFYARVAKLTFKSTNPLNNSMMNSVTGPTLSKSIGVTFDELNIYELYSKRTEVGSTLFLFPVHEVAFHHNSSESHHRGWPMAQTLASYTLDLVKVGQCSGNFCLMEKRNYTTGERTESISIQFTKGATELEIFWSPIFQWLQVSCATRIQCALARLKKLASNKESKKSTVSSHKTNIRIEVGSNVTANIRLFVGARSMVHIIFEGGTAMDIALAKYQSPSTIALKQMAKPDIYFKANCTKVFLNDIASPIFTFEGISLQNFLRRAADNEINEYMSKKENPTDAFCGDIATDQCGRPLKEIFDLNLGTVLAKFPPILHFGEVIEDFVLLPKALSIGLNRLKECHNRPVKKYQLMTIKCIIPFLDVSLMGNDPETTRNSFLDEFRICFEATEVSIERSRPPEWTQSQINDLDEDDSSTHSYGPVIQGGLMSLDIKHVTCTLRPLNLSTPLVCIDDFSINGYLHLAGLSPTTSGIQEGKTITSLLLCHHYHFSGNRVSAYNHRQCCCCYGVSLHSAGIPVKVYTNGRVNCGSLDISYGPVMNQSIPRLVECIQRLLPPPPKPVSQVPITPLTWWDNIRFFVHGSISIAANEMSVRWLLDSHLNRDQSIIFNCQKLLVAHNVGSFDIDAREIQVSVPGIGYAMSIHPSARDTKPIFHLPHESESAASQGRHPLIYVHKFKTEVNFHWKMLQPGGASSRHHSVYVKHKNEPTSDGSDSILDRFASFRSDGTDVQFDFELLGSDVCDNWVALRIDVLPWFTHLNSSMAYAPDPDENKPDPFPKFRSVAIKASTSNLRVATWFEDETDFDGLCLIVRTVNYNSTVDGNQDIVIEGPVKAAILDMSLFRQEENATVENAGINDIEQMAFQFGSSQSWNISEGNEHSTPATSVPGEDVEPNPFLKLQQLSRDISELDYVVVTGQIDIRNQSLARMLDGGDRETNESQFFAGVNRTTWSILVSRLKLLWTLEIRDSLFSIVKDLIYTVGFMKSQKRQLQMLSGTTTQQDQDSPDIPPSLVGEGVELSLRDQSENDRSNSLHESMLGYLLNESFDLERLSEPENPYHDNIGTTPTARCDDKEKKKGKATLPTLDIHFSNPQVQLHSTATGGSIILAMEGAHVEGRKFVHFLVAHAQSKAEVSPSDLLRKTEHIYTLTNLEAYSLSTHVDVNIGLPWLEVCSPRHRPPAHQTIALEERFGINNTAEQDDILFNENDDAANQQIDDERVDSNSSHEYLYPSHMRHHEPLSFLKSGLLRPILHPFTFQSKQIFHRPPIHYSTEELICYMNQGLVVGQDEAAVDNIELHIDLLNFNLDSYQFKTTLDVIRNVLLEPPKPHQRHQSFDPDDTDTGQTSLGRISSVDTTEMEELLKSDKHGGKKGRQMLRNSAMSLLRNLEDKIALDGSEIFRRVSYTLSKLQWCIESQEEINGVQISFTGFNGQHDYSRDGSIASQFSLEDLHVSSSRPGPDSISFSDPTSVVKSVLGNERSPCQRCDQHFDHSKNDLNSCVFHPGQYSGVWTCCKRTNPAAIGCRSGPHTGKERAVVVRVEALPRIVEGLSLYSHFEVNLFPGVLSTLVVQISKSMSKLFMTYFFVGGETDEEDDTVSTFSDVTSSTDTFSIQSDYSAKPTIRKKSLLIGTTKGSPSPRNLRNSDDFCEPESDIPSEFELRQEETKDPEIAFIKVWRVGYVDVDVSLGGFKRLPLSSLNISVPAYSKAFEVGTWEYHSRKYLTYLVREVLKSGASSGLVKVRQKIMGGSVSPSPSQTRDQLDSSVLESSSSPRSAPRMPTITDSIPAESFIGRHLRRSPVGAADILGTPAKRLPKKKKKILFKPK